MNWYWVAAHRNMKENIREPAYFEEIKKFNPASIAVPDDLKAIAEQINSLTNYCFQTMDIYAI